jgi:hypothetical protein
MQSVLYIIAIFVKDEIGAAKFSRMLKSLKANRINILSIVVVAVGYISEKYQHLWVEIETTFLACCKFPTTVKIIPFAVNSGKSSYINAAIQWANRKPDLVYNYIMTTDCDIQMESEPQLSSDVDSLISKMIYVMENAPHCGLVAPNQLGCNKHSSTIYQHEIELILPENICTLRLYWSDVHPSIAGGCWMFSKSTYEAVGPFQNVGSYGPEDVLFAWDVVEKLKRRCYLIDNVYVHHSI